MPPIGTTELIIILLLVLILFGASRLPALGRSIGVSMKDLKQAAREVREGEADAQ